MQQCSTWGCCYSAQKCCLMIDCLSQCTPELQGQPTQKLDLLEQWQMMLPGLKKLIFKWFIKVLRATINKHEGKDCWKEKKPWFSGHELNTNYFGLRGQFIPYCSLYSDTADSCFCLVQYPHPNKGSSETLWRCQKNLLLWAKNIYMNNKKPKSSNDFHWGWQRKRRRCSPIKSSNRTGMELYRYVLQLGLWAQLNYLYALSFVVWSVVWWVSKNNALC